MKLKYKVNNETKYINVKEVLKVEFFMSDRLLLKLKKLQKITLNDEIVYVHHPIKSGDKIICDLDYVEDSSNIVPNNMPLDIIYEDECYLIVNKPSNCPIHPSMEHYTDSLSNAVRSYFDSNNIHKKIRPVNRLDKDTSGLVIFAKNEYIQECLVRQMKDNRFIKKYIAIIQGNINTQEGTINLPIVRKQGSIIERCVDKNGQKSVTHYRVIQRKENFDIVECTLETGRTHQIRVHFSYLGYPLLGDTLYGMKSDLINRQALHCSYLEFIHPILKERVRYTSELPKDLRNII